MKRGTTQRMAKEGLVKLIQLYQVTISSLFGPCCRFTPSCSHYLLLSVQRFGVTKGLWVGLKRLSKCQPFHPGGFDPVPEVIQRDL